MASVPQQTVDPAFETAVMCVFQPGNVSQLDRQTAQAQLDDLASRPIPLFDTCMVHLERSQRVEVQFYALQALHGLIQSSGYAALDAGRKQALKQGLLRLGSSSIDPSSLPLFMRNKLAQVIVAIAAEEYPDAWPTFFADVLGSLNESPGSIDCFSRILISIHEDIISLEVPRSAAGAKASMTFKDAMRDNALEQVASSWYQMLVMFKSSNPGLVALLLHGVERYVNWIDISLVANERFMPVLFEVLNSSHSEAQVAAVGVLAEIVGKKMEAGVKLGLIQGLGLVPLVARWAETGLPGVRSVGALGMIEMEDHDLAVASAKLLVNMANEVLDAWKKVENSVISLQAVGVSLDDEVILEATASCQMATSMLEQLFPAVVRVLRIPDDDVSVIVAPFMLSYVSRIKMVSKRANGELSPAVRTQLVSLLEAAAVCARFESGSSIYPVEHGSVEEKVMAEEEEQSVSARRQDVFSLFRNTAKLVPAPAYELVASMLRKSLMANVPGIDDGNRTGGGIPSVSNWQDAEIALSLFYQLGEGVTEDMFKSGAHPLAELAAGIIQLDDGVASHRLVALALLEACARYGKVALFRRELLPALASKFFGKAGLGHPSSTVPPRAAYLLCRTVKSLRQAISAISRDILGALMPHLDAIARSPINDGSTNMVAEYSRPSGLVAAGASATLGASGAGVSSPDDRMFAFEAAGLLVGSLDDEEIQVEWIQALTRPLTEQLRHADGSLDSSASAPVETKRIEESQVRHQGESGKQWNRRRAALCRQSMEALTRISKGFAAKMCSNRLKLTQAILEPLGPATHAVTVFASVKDVRAKFLAYMHRLVECLGESVVPQLPSVFWALEHPRIDAGDFTDNLVLVNQIVVRFAGSQTVIDAVVIPLFADCSAKVHEFLGSSWDWSMRKAMEGVEDHGTGSTEDLREKMELQKQYYSLVNSVSQCPSVIDRVLLRDSAAVLDILQGAVSNVDHGVRKLCIATLAAIVHRWIQTYPDDVAVREAICVQFGCDVLIFSLLVKPEAGGIDIKDASSISLLSECANQIKSLATSSLGDDYLNALAVQLATRLGWSEQVINEVRSQIQALDGRALRTYLKSMIMSMR